MSLEKLLAPFKLGNIELKNKIVMAPMTRARAINNIPGDLEAVYYAQRATAGLIITEGVSPSPNGLGYARIPGIFSAEQVEGWKKVTSAIHAKGGKVFIQLMHTGRVAHPANLPNGARLLAPSAIAAAGEMWTDTQGMQTQPVPEALTLAEIKSTIAEYAQAATNAINAGFDGVELHGANGYLIEQFIAPNSNQRTDEYGGNLENRTRFALDVVKAVIDAIGKEKVGIRLSPFGVFNDIHPYAEIDATYTYLAEKLDELDIVYLHLVDHSSQGAPEVALSTKQNIRAAFLNTLILSGGYDAAHAEQDLESGFANLVAFGRPFLSNPDLVDRIKNNWPLNNQLDVNTLYTPGEKGYSDYPFYTA